MNRDEFIGLPPRVALAVLFDSLDQQTVGAIAKIGVPKLPMPPRYDMPIYRREGLQYASETDLSGLQFWHKKAVESASGGGQYAEKDRKKAAALERWIAWRKCYPDALWVGERSSEQVTARPPAAKPTIYPSSRGGAPKQQSQDDEVENF